MFAIMKLLRPANRLYVCDVTSNKMLGLHCSVITLLRCSFEYELSAYAVPACTYVCSLRVKDFLYVA